MQRVLKKRLLRDLKANCVRYLALSALIILCMYIIISLMGTADTIIQGSEEYASEYKLEDGQFKVFMPLTDDQKASLEKNGITLEEQFYMDYQLEDDSTIRVFGNREWINLVKVEQGRKAEHISEIVLEKRYTEEHNLKIGDTVALGGKEFEVVGIGSSPDYNAPYKEFGDSSVNSVQFGTAFVDMEAYKELLADGKSVKAEEYVYAYLLNGVLTNEQLKEILQELKVVAEGYMEMEISNLTQFLKVEDNPRAGAAAEDQIINKYGGMIAGVIILVLFAYVISVFVVYGIEKENSTIGALYALGVKRNELIIHYLCLPVVITFIAGILGCVIGFSTIGESSIMGSSYSYFSIPHMETVYRGYLFVYGIVLPPVISAIVNLLIIGKKLNKPALQMLRNEQKASGISKIKLRKFGFVTTFRIRQMLREVRTSITVIGGMFISLLILMLGLDCYTQCTNISKDNKEDTRFEYLYTYKYPEVNVPEGGYEAFAKTMKKDNLGYNLDVTVLGITEDNPFFDVELTESKNEAAISSAMAEKYSIEIGEEIVLEDEEAEKNYTFTVRDIVQYSTSFYVFMDIDSMRELFGESGEYYNQVFADKEISVEPDRLYAVTTKNDIIKAADVFINEMTPMITMMVCFSALIFVVVMYLMMKVMIDRSASHISMVKVFGYRMKEIKKLYLNGNFYVIAVGAAICIPLAKKCMDMMYPMMVSNVACGMNLKFSWQMYAGIYVAVIILYFVINQLLTSRLKRVNLAEILKNRE